MYYFLTGNRTPSHRTPSHDPARTPSHDPSRTPSHVGGAWDPAQPNTPARPNDEFDNYFEGAGPSPVSNVYHLSVRYNSNRTSVVDINLRKRHTHAYAQT